MNKYMTLKEIAEYYKVHDNTIRNWIDKENMPILKIGKVLRFDLQEVENWVTTKK